jgi:uracil-DNA glycosylase
MSLFPAAHLAAWTPEAWPVAPSWRPVVDAFVASPDGQALGAFIRRRLAEGATLFPPQPLRALELTPLPAVRAVILGQDPYHGAGQAEGLAFSVAPGVRLPPSLRNIFKELGQPAPSAGRPEAMPNGSLVPWAQRGVLLLNTCLTVEEGQPASHARRGWETLTDALIGCVAQTASPCVYFLWGAHAQAKAGLIATQAAAHGREVCVIQTNHPSPLSAARGPVPFLGSGQFDRARQWLAERGIVGVI